MSRRRHVESIESDSDDDAESAVGFDMEGLRQEVACLRQSIQFSLNLSSAAIAIVCHSTM